MAEDNNKKGFVAILEKLLMKDNNPSFLIFGILLIVGVIMIIFDRQCSYVINIGFVLIGISLIFALIRIFFELHNSSNSKHKEEISRIEKTHQKHVRDLKETIKTAGDSKGLENRLSEFMTIQNNTDNKLS
jgi:Zn-dependent membrane protease YugP